MIHTDQKPLKSKVLIVEPGLARLDSAMGRRFIPKGCDIDRYTCSAIRKIEEWINRYPRKILNFKTAAELFALELVA